MRAVVFHGIGDICLDDVPEPEIQEPTDASGGGLDGMQAEFVRVPFANIGMIKLPEEIDDEQAILLSGPLGQFAIAGALHLGAGRVIAVDTIPSRLEMARNQGAEIVDFNADDPVERIRDLTGGIGVDCAIDAVGVDAMAPHSGPCAEKEAARLDEHIAEIREIAPNTHPDRGNWIPGDAPSEVLEWGVAALAKAGHFAIIGVYPESARRFPIGKSMLKNLTLRMGNCNHRKYAPMLVEMVRAGVFHPRRILSQIEPLTGAIDAYKHFDERQPGWIKVELIPAA